MACHRNGIVIATLATFLMAGSSGRPSGEPLQVMLALDTSPGTEQAIGLLRPRAFGEADVVGVVTFSGARPRVLLPLTADREALASALQRAGIRVGAAVGRVRINDNGTVDLAAAIKLACEELRDGDSGQSRRAVIVLFGTADPHLQSQMQSVKASLDAAHARLYAVAVHRNVEQRRSRVTGYPDTPPFPATTASLMSELAEHSGGRAFLRNWDLGEIVRDARTR